MIAIIDYDAGNLASVLRALEFLDVDGQITADADQIRQAERVIFPGVGAAGEAMRNLRQSGLDTVIHEVIAAGTPFLGICLGYQVLFRHSEEDDCDCLGILEGDVVRFPEGLTEPGDPRPLKIPEMGWNTVTFNRLHPVWEGVPEGSEFYFVHSYYPKPDADTVCASTEYGMTYACGVAWKNLVAFQFHPEKSGRPGLHMLKNFCGWLPESC